MEFFVIMTYKFENMLVAVQIEFVGRLSLLVLLIQVQASARAHERMHVYDLKFRL
jgi:hypothetical protein